MTMKTRFLIEDDMIVRSLVKQLPRQQRKAILLRFWKDYSLPEIAMNLNITTKKASKLLKKGLLKIKFGCIEHPNFLKSAKCSFGRNEIH